MKPDYKNWVPRGLLFLLGGMAVICLAVCAVFGIAGVATEGGLRIALGVLFGAAFLLFAVLTGIFANMYWDFLAKRYLLPFYLSFVESGSTCPPSVSGVLLMVTLGSCFQNMKI